MNDALPEIFDNCVSYVIAEIMNLETGLSSFEGFTCDEDVDDTIMYVQMNEKDKRITKEGLEDILRKYADELGVPFGAIGEQ